MSLEATASTQDIAPSTVGMPDTGGSAASEFEAFSAHYDKLTAEPDRDEAGKFTSKETTTPEAEAAQVDEAKAEGETPVDAKPARPLPANWTPDMADILEGLDEGKAGKLLAHQEKLHRQMSDLGRAASQYKGIDAVVAANPRYFKEGGVDPAQGFAQLVQAQSRLDADPIAGIAWLAEHYGVKDQIFSGGEGAAPIAQETIALRQTIADLRQEIASMASPQAIDQHINRAFESRTAEDTVNRFAQSKPFYADVEAVLPDFIRLARTQAGEGASQSDVLESAYDMAVNAMPHVREKVRKAAPVSAAESTEKRAAAAAKAASVNVTSQQTGKPRALSEDESMNATWARLHA